MMGGTCANTESGVAGADKLCSDRASSAELPSGFSYTHKAMLHRGGTDDSAHPRNLDIPNKEREIRMVDNTTVIASHYDMSGPDNDYWDVGPGYVLANAVPERTDSTDSTRGIRYAWSGITDFGVPNDNCNDWEDGSGSGEGYVGDLAKNQNRFDSSGAGASCNVFQYPPDNAVGLLCASY